MTIFLRDLRERSRLLTACIVLAAVPFLATLLPSARGHRADVVAIIGGSLAICIGLGVALGLGNSVVARDLAERRMSFYFAKPLRPAALWIGKAGAALATTLFCFLVIAVPAMMFAGPAWDRRWLGDTQPIFVGALTISVLFFVSHAFATVVRSRSPLLALDFLFAILGSGVLIMIVWPVLLGRAIQLVSVLVLTIAVAVLIILAIAPIWQLEHGRADVRRSHAAFSRFFWPAVAVVLLVAGGYVWWLVSPDPQDLDEVLAVEQPQRGNEVIVTGGARGRGDYNATFLIDQATGKYERLSTPPWWGLQASKDGKVIAWLQPAGIFSLSRLELYVRGRATGILLSHSAHFVLSDDGSRVATDTGRMVTVYDVATGRILASAAGFDPRSQAHLFFPTNDVVRIYETQPLRISELDIPLRKVTRLNERALATPAGPSISVSGDGTRMFVRGPNIIADARTGATIATIDPDRGSAAMLHDGSVAMITWVAGGPRLRLYAPDGTRRHEIPLAPTQNAWVAGEVEGGKLLIASRGGATYVVDVHRGTIVQKHDDLRANLLRWSVDPRMVRHAADQELVARRDGKLVVWSPTSGGAPRPLWKS
ncbi:MAG TPA: hypothetical protein VNI54_14525 [Thermoanaerobaculia bacterium]|nr:hypothetical protein [Thermoanaerobaculia bacterium]